MSIINRAFALFIVWNLFVTAAIADGIENASSSGGGSAPCSAFGTTSGTCAQGGVITAGGPTGSATVAPIITYNAAGQLTTVSSATITPAVGSITGLGTGVATGLANNATGSGSPVLATSPTLVTPVLGVATATSLDGAAIGAITPSTGAFTTLSASSTVSGTGFSTYLASPPAIGGTTAAAGTFTAIAGSSLALSGVVTFSASTSITAGSSGNPTTLTIKTSNQTGANNASTMTIAGGANSQASGTNNAGGVAITGGNASGAGSTGNGGSVTITAGTSVGGTAGSIQLASLTTANTRLTVGSATAAVGQNGDLGLIKETDAAAAPGAGYAVLKWVAGSGSSCNLIAYAGTSATPVTIASTVGSGC
jgi:hypothetical protein